MCQAFGKESLDFTIKQFFSHIMFFITLNYVIKIIIIVISNRDT